MAIRIAVAGAGCAALGAATELVGQKQIAVDVTLIEPNDWIGGRARTHAKDGLPVDLGPQFVQDPQVNPWRVILEQMPDYDLKKIKPIAMDGQFRVKGEDQKWSTIDHNQSIDKGNELLELKYNAATAFKNNAPLSIEDAKILKDNQYYRLAFGSSEYGAIAESAEPWQYLASDRDRQTSYESAGNIYVPGGLGTLVENYGKKLLMENPRILHLLKDRVAAIDDTDKKEVVLTTGADVEIKADFCILTMPCAELYKVKYAPPLTGTRVRALGSIGLGSYKKVAFRPHEFPKENGIKEGVEYYIFDDKADGVWQYFRLPTDPTILICVASGDFAARLDQGEDLAASQAVIALLSAAYDMKFIAKDGKVVVTNWTKTPGIGGAYSYTLPDHTLDLDNPTALEARLQIAKPYGRIHFAGEATWADAYGTIHGAYHSGVRAAREILDAVRSI